MRKSVFSVDVNDNRSKKAAIQAVSGFQGIESLSIELEKKTLTVVGDVDPVKVVRKLRKLKLFRADIETVGPNEEKGDNKKKEEVKDDKNNRQHEMEQIFRDHYNAYYPNYRQPYYYYPRYVSVEDDTSTCVIS